MAEPAPSPQEEPVRPVRSGSDPDAPTIPDPTPDAERGLGSLLDRLRSGSVRGRRYRLLGELARGGMGAILRVWDDELRRTLAMKVALGTGASAGPGTPALAPKTLGRFLEEAQVTGQLDHPGIVPVHELGLDSDGRVYFTMRLVRGEDLSKVFEHARASREGWTELRVLGVLLKVCEAMSYAHAKQVVHRDLKPSNVMVGKFGEVYVMDWGLARVLGHADIHGLRLRSPAASQSVVETERREQRDETPDSPLITMDGDVVGTPSFMSPEQARGDLEKIGPRSDVYAVGAMLYQLLTGEMPFVPSGVRVSQYAVLMRLLEGPPRPVQELAPDAPAELVAIVEKAMARELERRYAGMSDLAEDLRAFAEGRVVRAFETGAWAETRKWVARNRALAASLAAVIFFAVAGAIAFAGQARKARAALVVATTEKARADEQARQAVANAVLAQRNAEAARDAQRTAEESQRRTEKVTELVQKALIGSDPYQGGTQDLRVVEAMERAMAELDAGALGADSATEAALQLTLARILDGNSRSADGLRLAQAGTETMRKLHPGDHDEVAAGISLCGACLGSLGKPEGAVEQYRQSLAMYERLHPGDHELVAGQLSNLALGISQLGRDTEALALHEQALAIRRRLFPGDSHDVAISLGSIGNSLLALGQASDARTRYQESLEMKQRLFRGDHVSIAADLGNLGACDSTLGRLDDALDEYEQGLEMTERLFRGDHPMVALARNNVGAVLQKLGQEARALTEFENGLAMQRRLFAGDHPFTAKCLGNVASCLKAVGRRADALPKYREALEMNERLYRGDHPDIAIALNNLATCLESLSRISEAATEYGRALEMSRRLYPGDHPLVARLLDNVGMCSRRLGRSNEALEPLEQGLAMRRRLYAGDHPDVAQSLNSLGGCLHDLAQDAESLPHLEAALAMRQRLFQGDNPAIAISLNNLALTLRSLKRAEEALPRFEASVAMLQRIYGGDHPDIATGLSMLAGCLDALGRSAHALPQHEAAVAMRQRLFDGDHADIATGVTNRGTCLFKLGRLEAALADLVAALEMYERLFPGEHPAVARALHNVAFCLAAMDRKPEALEYEIRASEMGEHVFPADHPMRASIAETLKSLRGDLPAKASPPEDQR